LRRQARSTSLGMVFQSSKLKGRRVNDDLSKDFRKCRIRFWLASWAGWLKLPGFYSGQEKIIWWDGLKLQGPLEETPKNRSLKYFFGSLQKISGLIFFLLSNNFLKVDLITLLIESHLYLSSQYLFVLLKRVGSRIKLSSFLTINYMNLWGK
jgi:hypothetical protein